MLERCQKPLADSGFEVGNSSLWGGGNFLQKCHTSDPRAPSSQAEIPAHISRHLLGASNEFCNMWLTQGSGLYSDIIAAHSAVHESAASFNSTSKGRITELVLPCQGRGSTLCYGAKVSRARRTSTSTNEGTQRWASLCWPKRGRRTGTLRNESKMERLVDAWAFRKVYFL